ncbi:MAG: hypothetical protein J3Q66DRAFT_123568 [Benniella sp.]|nr:MAG: hypothetical protein J3Q66DRAFT_123568 [Benniella sp.]
MGFEGSQEDVEGSVKLLKVFTSSKKDDDGEFRKGQQFYLNIQLNPEDRERYRYLRIPTENIVLPCRADGAGRINLNTSGKRGAQTMMMPTSAQEEDVLSLKLTTYLEPEHRVVVPCGRCKDKTPEILRFHPGVNGKPMIDENGMVALRDGHVKLIASAWCASTSHHRGPGTKFSFRVELSGMTRHQVDPALVYEGRSDEVEIYASHGRDKGTRLANKNLDKSSKSHSPPLHDRSTGPPSPAKTTASSPPSSPSASTTHYEGPSKKRREDPPLTPPIIDHDLPPTIKSLEPRKGPICRENHVIIIGSNFAHGMTPMFGREHGTVIEVNPFYIECTTPIYPNVETVPVWIYHNDTFTSSDKTYDFTNELAQSDLELLLRNVLPANGEGLDAASFMSLMGRLPGVPSSTDISGQTASNGSTMLHNAALLGYQKGVDMLIEEGIELDIEDDAGFTALDYAIFINNVEITEALLLAGSMPSYERMAKLPLVPTIEMSALLRDMCDIDLPESSTSRESEQELDGTSASEEISGHDNELAHAAEGGVLPDTASETMGLEEDQHMSLAPISEQVRVLRNNPRPLSIATVSTQSTGMVSIAPTMSTLASSAASSTLISPQHSRHPRAMISRPGNQVHKGGLENIWQCAKKGNLDMVKHHLQKEPTLINTPWKFDGRSALSSACASSQPQELVEFLVTCGAHVNQADTFYKRTALHTLCEEGGLSQDDWGLGMTQAEREANERDVLAAMRFLLDNGADVNAKNHWKETALMRLFLGRDCPLMVQELYSRGADSRLKSSKDAYPHGTALCYAAFYGRIKSLKWMIENDLLLNDEVNIKEAIRWAKLNKNGSSSHSQSSTMPSAAMIRKKEEKAEVIRLLESWLGDAGLTKRKALAKDVADQSSEDWWRRMSGIVDDQTSKHASTTDMDVSSRMDLEDAMEASHAKEESDSQSDSKMPLSMMPLWREVQTLSEGLSQGSDTVTSPSRMKWLTMLRK